MEGSGLEEEAKEVEKVVIKFGTQAVIREGAIEDEEAAREASGNELSEVRVPFSSRLFSHWLINLPAKAVLMAKKEDLSRCCHGHVHCR